MIMGLRCSPFGSHVLESIIATLAGCLDDPVDGDSALVRAEFFFPCLGAAS